MVEQVKQIARHNFVRGVLLAGYVLLGILVGLTGVLYLDGVWAQVLIILGGLMLLLAPWLITRCYRLPDRGDRRYDALY